MRADFLRGIVYESIVASDIDITNLASGPTVASRANIRALRMMLVGFMVTRIQFYGWRSSSLMVMRWMSSRRA